MKILFCIHSFNINGVLSQNFSFIKYLIKNHPKFEIDIIAHSDGTGFQKYLNIGLTPKVVKNPEQFDISKYDNIFFESLFSLNYFNCFLEANKKTIVRIHEEFSEPQKNLNLWNSKRLTIEKYFLLMKNSEIIFLGEHTKNSYLKYLKKRSFKTHTIGNVIDCDKFELKTCNNPKKFTITQIGTIYKRKGAIETLQAFSIFSNKVEEENILLKFVGKRAGKKEEERYVKQLEKKIKKLNLTDKVKIVEMDSEVQKHYVDSSIITLHSISESYPTVYLESSYMNIPFVSSAVGCIEEMATTYGNAFLFKPGNVELQAKYFQQIWENRTSEMKSKLNPQEQREIYQKNLNKILKVILNE